MNAEIIDTTKEDVDSIKKSLQHIEELLERIADHKDATEMRQKRPEGWWPTD